MLENVALMAEYHRRAPGRRAEPEARSLLERMGLGWAADQAPERLGPDQVFAAQLARAAARANTDHAQVVLVEPFVLLAGAADAAPIREPVGRLALPGPTLVLDYAANGGRYAPEEHAA